jgi:hypothetical protein
LFERDLFRKPVSTFRDHALTAQRSSAAFDRGKSPKTAKTAGCGALPLERIAGQDAQKAISGPTP